MNSNDLLVDLYQQDFVKESLDFKVKRVISTDSDSVIDFIQQRFSPIWVSEVKSGLFRSNPTCFIAVDEKQIVGFACYDATSKGFFIVCSTLILAFTASTCLNLCVSCVITSAVLVIPITNSSSSSNFSNPGITPFSKATFCSPSCFFASRTSRCSLKKILLVITL